MADAVTTDIDPAQSTLSPNFANYIYDMLARGQAAASQPFQEYTGQRFAGASPLQQQAFSGLGALAGAYPSQFDTATRFATQAGRRAGQTQYVPGQFTMGQVNAPTLQEMQMQAPADVVGSQAQAAQLSAAPQVQAAQMQGPGAIGFERAQAERVAAPSLQNLQMQAAAPVGIGALQTYQMGPAERVGTQGFTPQTAADLMSPYMQNVVDIQQREAQRQADIAATGRGAQAVRAGAFGGARQAIERAEAARNLAQQKEDIQARGLQSAYQQAQQQFNTQQQAALQAALANQQAGLTTGQQNLAAQLGVQQLGTQAGLQAALANQQAQQQANLQNLSAGLQTQGLQAQTGLQAQQLNQATGLQAALANQQAGMQTGQFNAQQAYNTALQNAQLQQQAALANQQLGGQYGLQQGQFGQQAALQNAQMAQQAALANQQMGYNTGLQNLQARLGVQQLGAGQNLQAQLANQQALMQAQQAAEQSRQFGANVGLQGTGQQLSAANTLGQLGTGQFGTQLQGLQALLGAGGTQQQLAQQPLDFGYQQYQQSLQYPYQQATFMQSLLGGLPLQATPYNAGQSGITSALQGGLAGLGLYNLFNKP